MLRRVLSPCSLEFPQEGRQKVASHTMSSEHCLCVVRKRRRTGAVQGPDGNRLQPRHASGRGDTACSGIQRAKIARRKPVSGG